MLPEFPRGTAVFLYPGVAHCNTMPSCHRPFAHQTARRNPSTPHSRPANQRPGFACPLLASVSRALRPDRADSIPIAPPSARWFSPTGFLAYRSRWRRHAAHQTRCTAPARLKTLCNVRTAERALRAARRARAPRRWTAAGLVLLSFVGRRFSASLNGRNGSGAARRRFPIVAIRRISVD